MFLLLYYVHTSLVSMLTLICIYTFFLSIFLYVFILSALIFNCWWQHLHNRFSYFIDVIYGIIPRKGRSFAYQKVMVLIIVHLQCCWRGKWQATNGNSNCTYSAAEGASDQQVLPVPDEGRRVGVGTIMCYDRPQFSIVEATLHRLCQLCPQVSANRVLRSSSPHSIVSLTYVLRPV